MLRASLSHDLVAQATSLALTSGSSLGGSADFTQYLPVLKGLGGPMKAKNVAFGAKTEFVRALPEGMSAKEVVARAKQKGLTLSEAHVYNIRSETKKRTSGKGKVAARRATNSSGGGSGQPAMTAAAFVRALPAHTSGKAAVEQAAAAGVKLTPAYFYILKSKMGISARAQGSRGAADTKQHGAHETVTQPAARLSSGMGSTQVATNAAEQALIGSIAALGLARVRELVSAVERLKRG
jgi:hypothetical protein